MSIDPRVFCEALQRHEVQFFAGVPDSLLKDLCAFLTDNLPSEKNIIAANEGSALGMACGFHLATGKYGCVYLQNSGEGNLVNPLTSLADPDVYSIPLLMIVGWRGQPGVPDEPQHAKQGKITCSFLECMGVPYCVLGDDWEAQLEELMGVMKTEQRPVALVVPKKTFDAYSFKPAKNDAPLLREQALKVVMNQLGEDDFIVSTTGKTSREVFEIREERGQSHSNDFLVIGGMGHAASVSFGMAIGTDKNVWCIDGDGSFLMHMGSLPVIAQNAPANFKYILNNNGAHESVGGQPTVGQRIDVVGILKASGFSFVAEVSTEEEIERGMKELAAREKAALVITTCQGSRSDLGRPTITPLQQKRDMMERFGQLR